MSTTLNTPATTTPETLAPCSVNWCDLADCGEGDRVHASRTAKMSRDEYDLETQILRDDQATEHVVVLDLTDDPISAEGVRVLIRDLAVLVAQLDALDQSTAS